MVFLGINTYQKSIFVTGALATSTLPLKSKKVASQGNVHFARRMEPA
jgi:hypothetical protein